jgi:hypothetical protein
LINSTTLALSGNVSMIRYETLGVQCAILDSRAPRALLLRFVAGDRTGDNSILVWLPVTGVAI